MLPTRSLKDFLEPRLNKYEQFVADCAEVVASYELIHNDFVVKLRLSAFNRTEVVAIEKDSNIYVALDKAIVKIERQLLKKKKKMEQRNREINIAKDYMPDYGGNLACF